MNLSEPLPPVSSSLQLPDEVNVSLPFPPTFSELHIPLIVVTLSLTMELPSLLPLLFIEEITLLDKTSWLVVGLDSLFIRLVKLSKLPVSLSESEIKLFILDFKFSEKLLVV